MDLVPEQDFIFPAVNVRLSCVHRSRHLLIFTLSLNLLTILLSSIHAFGAPFPHLDPAVWSYLSHFSELLFPYLLNVITTTLQDYYDLLLFFKNNYLNAYLFFDRETQNASREGQREGETQNPKQAPGSELSTQSPTQGLNTQTEITTWAEVGSSADWAARVPLLSSF